MRPDKAALAGVAATLSLYRAGLAVAEIPTWRMIAATRESLRTRAAALAGRIPGTSAVELTATVGGARCRARRCQVGLAWRPVAVPPAALGPVKAGVLGRESSVAGSS